LLGGCSSGMTEYVADSSGRLHPIAHYPDTTFTAHGQTYCAIHRVPFVTRRMYEPSLGILVHCGDERCAECGERFPNSIAPEYRSHRTRFFHHPTTVAYCPVCQEAFLRC